MWLFGVPVLFKIACKRMIYLISCSQKRDFVVCQYCFRLLIIAWLSKCSQTCDCMVCKYCFSLLVNIFVSYSQARDCLVCQYCFRLLIKVLLRAHWDVNVWCVGIVSNDLLIIVSCFAHKNVTALCASVLRKLIMCALFHLHENVGWISWIETVRLLETQFY